MKCNNFIKMGLDAVIIGVFKKHITLCLHIPQFYALNVFFVFLNTLKRCKPVNF